MSGDSSLHTISLLVPVFNGENYLKNFFNNVHLLNGTFDEIIFFNDGSTDSSLEILKASGYSYIDSPTNKGQGFARNKLAESATSTYIHFHDVDDAFDPDFLKLVRLKIKSDLPDVILGNANWIDLKSKEIIIEWRYCETEILKDPINYFVTHPLGIINTVYKKISFLNINGFNEQYKCWEDADIHVRLAIDKAKFSVIDKVIAYSLRHNSGVSSDQNSCWNCRLKFLVSYMESYSNLIDRSILKIEVKKVQTAFVNQGMYSHLKDIFLINKKYSLAENSTKLKLIYYLNKYLVSSYNLKKIHHYLINLRS
jgi:glycosyltransferase involved in cell wall biosynthesis